MSTSSPKKPPSTSASDRRPASTNSQLNRSPSRMAGQTTTTTTTTPSSTASPTSVNNNNNKSRAARTSTPVSARAAAAARKSAPSISEASAGAGAGTGAGGAGSEEAEMDYQTKLAALETQLQETALATTSTQKHASVLQIKLDEALKEQAIMEDTVQAHVERIEELELEKKESLRARRELEQIYEAERVQVMREKEEREQEREELVESLRRLKEGFAQRELRERVGGGSEEERRPSSLSRTSSLRSADPSPNPESRNGGGGGGGEKGFAPQGSSLQRSDSRNSSRLVLQKDKVIEGLRLELAEAQIKLVELENKGGNSLHQLEKDMYDIKMQNARLMEENESFQLLLSEKTLNGDLAQSELLRPPSNTGDSPPRRSSSAAAPRPRAISLADELDDAHEESGLDESEAGDAVERKLQAEVNSMKDQNKALTLYINNIISRLLQHEQFEAILDKTPDLMAGPGAASRKFADRKEAAANNNNYAVGADMEKELPPAPQQQQQQSPPEQQQQQGLLQRAGSVLRRKQRPGSVIQQPPPQPPSSSDQPKSSDEPTTVHENPDTAPRILLGPSSSMNRGPMAAGAAHRRSRSDWGGSAAAVVGNMYRGPAPSVSGPMSPGLTSAPPNRTSFFPTSTSAAFGGGADGRGLSSGGGSVPTVSEFERRNKENEMIAQQQRDSKITRPSSSSSSTMGSPERNINNNNNITTTSSSTRNSIQLSNPDIDATITAANEASDPSSPPQSTNSSGDRDPRGPSGAIMMGSKPRPLRLVQEADEEKASRRAVKGQSWFGWMNKGAGAGPPPPPGSSAGGSAFGGFLQGKGEGGQQQQQ